MIGAQTSTLMGIRTTAYSTAAPTCGRTVPSDLTAQGRNYDRSDHQAGLDGSGGEEGATAADLAVLSAERHRRRDLRPGDEERGAEVSARPLGRRVQCVVVPADP